MADFFDRLEDDHVAMLAKQPIFFVATAPPDGRINLSPKGYDAFRVLSPTRVAYLDLAGRETRRMRTCWRMGGSRSWCAISSSLRLILRIYGTGRPVLPSGRRVG